MINIDNIWIKLGIVTQCKSLMTRMSDDYLLAGNPKAPKLRKNPGTTYQTFSSCAEGLQGGTV